MYNKVKHNGHNSSGVSDIRKPHMTSRLNQKDQAQTQSNVTQQINLYVVEKSKADAL